MTHSFVKCEAVKVSYRQTKDGMVVAFAVHPNDMPPELALAAVGTRVLLAVAELVEGAPEPEPEPAPPSDRSDAARLAYQLKDGMAKAATRAAMLCRDEEFQDWLSEAHHALWSATMHAPHGRDQYAIRALRSLLQVQSRSQISSDERAYEAFLALETSFKQATGQFAEAR